MFPSGSKLDRVLHTQSSRCETEKSGCLSSISARMTKHCKHKASGVRQKNNNRLLISARMATAHTKQQVWDRKTRLLISARMATAHTNQQMWDRKIRLLISARMATAHTDQQVWDRKIWLISDRMTSAHTNQQMWDRKIRLLISDRMTTATQSNRCETEKSGCWFLIGWLLQHKATGVRQKKKVVDLCWNDYCIHKATDVRQDNLVIDFW